MADQKVPPALLLPPAFGPASWYRTPEGLIPIYTRVRWHKDEKIDPADPPPPIEIEIEEDLSGAFYPRAISLSVKE